jgi:hypothetical protein
MAIDSYLDGEILYKRSFNETLLRCLKEKEVEQALKKIHEGICATHANRYTLTRKIQRSGYLWLTIKRDRVDYVK